MRWISGKATPQEEQVLLVSCVGTGLLGQRSHIHVVHLAQGKHSEQMEGHVAFGLNFQIMYLLRSKNKRVNETKSLGLNSSPKSVEVSHFIMHKLCGVRTGNYDSFNWK